MPRKSRIEYAGARYHVINRDNYRSWIFETEGARKSFHECLSEACVSMSWRLYAWCLMEGGDRSASQGTSFKTLSVDRHASAHGDAFIRPELDQPPP